MTVRAIYEGGVFKPAGPVNLPDKTQVELEATLVEQEMPKASVRGEQARTEIFEILSRRYNTGQTDTAQRHNEHQP